MAHKVLPRWSPRLAQQKLQRLYELDAAGLDDEALIDEVGYALFARCQSFLAANGAVDGHAPCANCDNVVLHSGDKDELLHCVECGWELTWRDYFATIQRKQLSGAEPVRDLFRTFVDQFPRAERPQDKMLLIDQLIHGYHWHMAHGPTRPVAVNLIEGRLWDVIDILDRLTYGTASTPGAHEVRAEWLANSRNVRRWSRTRADRHTDQTA